MLELTEILREGVLGPEITTQALRPRGGFGAVPWSAGPRTGLGHRGGRCARAAQLAARSTGGPNDPLPYHRA